MNKILVAWTLIFITINMIYVYFNQKFQLSETKSSLMATTLVSLFFILHIEFLVSR